MMLFRAMAGSQENPGLFANLYFHGKASDGDAQGMDAHG